MYAMCFKRRLLPGAICGETVKRKTMERDLDDPLFKEEEDTSAVKLKGKALRKLGDQEFY
jgi:hypothetical protein